MKKIVFALMLFVTGAAWADWVIVGESPESTVYVDPATIRKEGDLRKVWGIQDLKERDKDGEKSRRYREEYDCKGARKRYLSATTHSETMAGGTPLLTTSDPSPWTDIRPGSVADDILKQVCADQ